MKKNNTFPIIIVSLIITLGVYLISDNTKKIEAASSLSSSLNTIASSFSNSSSGIEVDTSFINSLTALNSIKIDTSIFANQIFNSLKDNSVKLESVSLGRSNPFAPIEVSSSKISSSTVVTSKASSVTDVGAILNGSVSGGAEAVSAYFEYGNTPATLGKTTSKANISLIGTFMSNVSSLSPQTTYFYRAVVKTATNTIYGEIVSFTTN